MAHASESESEVWVWKESLLPPKHIALASRWFQLTSTWPDQNEWISDKNNSNIFT